MRRIIIDTREQKPYEFPEFETVSQALDAGDYSLEGLENRIAIERKSMDDLVHTLLAGKKRFCRELAKLRSYDYAYIVVEGSIRSDVLAGRYKSQLKPEALLGMICAWELEFYPVCFKFCEDRIGAKAFVSKTLQLLDMRYPLQADSGTAVINRKGE
jgi:DNA excision repair protein ERCC-4